MPWIISRIGLTGKGLVRAEVICPEKKSIAKSEIEMAPHEENGKNGSTTLVSTESAGPLPPWQYASPIEKIARAQTTGFSMDRFFIRRSLIVISGKPFLALRVPVSILILL